MNLLSNKKPVQSGLIAEEVAEVFPELAIRNNDGQPESVAYYLLVGLLLNELQKEHSRVEAQEKRISELEQRVSRTNNKLKALATANDSSVRVRH